MATYCFLNDAFPTWKEKATKSSDLFEDFSSNTPTEVRASFNNKPVPVSPKQAAINPVVKKDMDLRVDYPLVTNRGPGPQPFDV